MTDDEDLAFRERADVMRAALHASLDDVVDAWIDALRAAFSTAAAERARELRGDRSVKAFRGGTHTYSVEWGRVFAAEELLPGLSDARTSYGERGPVCDPVTMLGAARRHAEQGFEEQVREGTVEWAS